MTCSFLLTSHWPKQVTGPCLQPMGLRNITLDQEGAGNILTVLSLVMQRLFSLQPTPCPGVRGHFCPAAFLLCTLFSKTTAQHLLSWSLLTCYLLDKAFPHHRLPLTSALWFSILLNSSVKTSMSVYVYMFTCTHVYTHTLRSEYRKRQHQQNDESR